MEFYYCKDDGKYYKYELQEYGKGQGYPIRSYRPKDNEEGLKQCIAWTFERHFKYDELSSLKTAVERKKHNIFSDIPNVRERRYESTGEASWTWPNFPSAKQKFVHFNKFDQHNQYFKGGAHMPLTVYIGEAGEERRSKGRIIARREERRTRISDEWIAAENNKHYAAGGTRRGGGFVRPFNDGKGKQKGKNHENSIQQWAPNEDSCWTGDNSWVKTKTKFGAEQWCWWEEEGEGKYSYYTTGTTYTLNDKK